MANHFEATDPRGYKIICTEKAWSEHILGAHPDMKDSEQLVINALEKPSLGIYKDADFDERNIYYYRLARTPRYMKVVVKFDEDNSGTVITAFYTDSPKSGEKLIWLNN